MKRLSVLFTAVVALSIAACTTPDEPVREEGDAEAARLPNPPPRYPRNVDIEAGPPVDGGEGELHIRCGGYKPYVCPLEDGGFTCSERPCVPDCTRVGCVGGDTCIACEEGYRCVAPGSGC